MKTLTAICGLAAAVLLTGCASSGPATATSTPVALGAVNDSCPMSGRPVDANSMVSYKGYDVGFCCGGCKGPWVDKTEAEKDQYLAEFVKK